MSAGGTERIDIIVTDNGTVRAIKRELVELAKAASFSGPNKRSDYGNSGEGIHQIAMRVARGGDKLVRKAALACSQTVTMATPVDTGRARANWVAQLNDPFEGVVDGYDPSGMGAVTTQAEAIAGYDGDVDREIHITNNLRYITPLNNGHSAQAPAGFVEEAVQAAAEVVRTVKNGIISDGY